MADANKTLITRAEYDTIIVPETGQRTLFMDGERIELGSTGVRDITGDLEPGTVSSGRLLIERIGNTVALRFDALTLATGTGGGVSTIRTGSSTGPIRGFRPRGNEWKTMKVRSDGLASRFNVSPSMNVQIQFALADTPMHGSMVWLTEAGWPSSLPGVEDGQSI